MVRASHRYREVTGSNPVEDLNFSGFYIRNCISCVHNCEDHSLLVQDIKYFIYKLTDLVTVAVFLLGLVKRLCGTSIVYVTRSCNNEVIFHQ